MMDWQKWTDYPIEKNKQTGWVGAVFFLFVVSIELFHIVYPRRIFAESPYRSRTFALKCAFVK